MGRIQKKQQQKPVSPFEALKREEEGRELWSARAMQELLGYVRWGNFQGAIARMGQALENSGRNPVDHMLQVQQLVEIGSGAKRETADYQLSRFAAYLLAMNGDPANPQVAQAQAYFAIMTRYAEVNLQPVVSALAIAAAYGVATRFVPYHMDSHKIPVVGTAEHPDTGKDLDLYPRALVIERFMLGSGPRKGVELRAYSGGWNPVERPVQVLDKAQ